LFKEKLIKDVLDEILKNTLQYGFALTTILPE